MTIQTDRSDGKRLCRSSLRRASNRSRRSRFVRRFRRSLRIEQLEARLPLSVTYVVDSLDDPLPSCQADGQLTLREAVYAANTDTACGDAPAGSGDDIVQFAPSLLPGTILLNGHPLPISDDLTITGPGWNQLTIDAADMYRHFEVNASVTATISGLWLMNGNAGEGNDGGSIYSLGDLVLRTSKLSNNRAGNHGGAVYAVRGTVEDCQFVENHAYVYGGGVWARDSFDVSSSIFDGNLADESGGGIYAQNGPLTVDDGSFLANTAAAGSGGGIWGRQVTVQDSIFRDNVAHYAGGGISGTPITVLTSVFTDNRTEVNSGGAIEALGALDVQDSEFHRNRAEWDGGAIVTRAYGPVVIGSSRFEDNEAQRAGGALFNVSQTTVDDSTFLRNIAYLSGGAIFAHSDDYELEITASTLAENTAHQWGGGLFTSQRTVFIAETTIRDNSAELGGGGVLLDQGSTTIRDSLISGNVSADEGGGISVALRGELTLFNSTVTGNSAAHHGGGLYLGNTANTTPLTNATIADNVSDSDDDGQGSGGGIFTAGTTPLLHNTIVANNVQGTAPIAFDIAGTVDAASSNNLIGDGSTAGGLADGTLGNLVGFDPLLGPLQDNGGPTLTRALSAGSPAIDAGDNARAVFPDRSPLIFDQRGFDFDRIVGLHVDVGAYEVQGPGGQISGRKWLSPNSTVGVAIDTVIYLDLDGDDQFDPGEPVATLRPDDPNTVNVDETGTYRFTGLPAGDYRVRELVPPGFQQVSPPAPGTHLVTIVDSEHHADIDFGNRLAGEISGWKCFDANGNGICDRNPLLGDAPDVLMVIDVSDSAASRASGLSVGNLNGDGTRNRVLDAEIYAMLRLRQELIDLGWGNSAQVGIIVMSSKAERMDMDPRKKYQRVTTTALADNDGNGTSDLVQVLRSIRAGEAGTGVDTDFEEALSLAVSTFEDLGSTAGQANLFFCSDGWANSRWSYIEEVEQLEAMGVHRVALAFGTSPDLETLRAIDPQTRTFATAGALATAIAARSQQQPDSTSEYLEPGMSGVTIYLDANANGQLDWTDGDGDNAWDLGEGERWTLTRADDVLTPDVDEEGTYRFDDLSAGQYTVREVVPSGYQQSLPPPPGSYQVDISTDSPTAEGIDFANRLVSGSVGGLKCLDTNGNGQQDAGEPGLSGVTIYLDLNNNATLDSGEPSTVTANDNTATPNEDETGTFLFANVPPGDYIVREILPAGYESTGPLSHAVSVITGQLTSGLMFLNFPIFGGIAGMKWLDVNGDGNFDNDESGFGDVPVRIYLDLNNNGRRNNNEPSVLTRQDDPNTPEDETGWWEFANVVPGTYRVCEEPVSGYQQTYPAGGACHIVTVGRLDTISGLLFGNFLLPPLPAGLCGLKFLDLDGNGRRDPNRLHGDQPDLIFTIDVSDSMKYGYSGNPQAGCPVGDVNGDGSSDTKLDLELAALIALNRSLIDRGLCDLVQISIIVFTNVATSLHMDPATNPANDDQKQLITSPCADSDGNGVPDVEQILRSIGFGEELKTDYLPPLQEVDRILDALGTSDENANVLFVSDGEPNDQTNYWDQATELRDRGVRLSAFGVGLDATLHNLQPIDRQAVRFGNPCELVQAFTFPAVPPGAASGNPFAGSSDGLWAEPGLAGVTIYVDLDNDGQLDWLDADGDNVWDEGEGEPWVLTREDDPATPDVDETGQWEITGLPPGVYVVREVPPPFHQPTLPASAMYQVNLQSGQVVKNLDFGNQPPLVLQNTIWTLGEDADTSDPIRVADIVLPHASLGADLLTLTGDDAGLFEIFGQAVFLTAGSQLDFETNPILDVTVEVDDPAAGNSPDGSGSLVIRIRDVNEMPTGITLSPSEIAENTDTSAGDVPVGTLFTTDEDTNNEYRYEFVPGAGDLDNGSFVIVDDQLLARQGVVLDYEQKAVYFVRINVNDGVNDLEKALTIAVTDVNLAPTAVLLSSAAIAENLPADTFVGTFASVDDEPPAGPYTYALVPGEGDDGNVAFTVIGDQLRSAVSFDYEQQSTYSIRVRSTDAGGLFLDRVFTIAVTDVNLSPTDLSLSNRRVIENQPVGAWVGSFTTTDGEPPAHEFVYSLVPGDGDADNASFRIAGDQLQTNAIFDFETRSAYSVRVRTTDAGGLWYEASFAITITDQNLAPTDITLSSDHIAEDLPAGSTVGVFGTVDAEPAAQPFTYALVPGVGDADNAAFTVLQDQLVLAVTPDYEVKPSYSIRVRTTDAGWMSYDKIFLILVDDVNEAPIDIHLSSAEVVENAPEGTLVGTLSASDPEAPAAPFAYALVEGEGDSDNGAFSVEGNMLKTNAVFDYETRSIYTIRLRVTDAGGLWFEEPFLITITNENRAPTSMAISNSSLAEDLPAGAIVGIFTTVDEEEPSAPFTYSFVPGTSGTDNDSFAIVGDRLLTAEVLDYESQPRYTIYVRSTDQGGLSYDRLFTIDLIDVNLAPTEIVLSSDHVAENQPIGTLVGMLSTSDPEAPAAPFTYTLVPGDGDDDNSSFTIDGGQLKAGATFDFETQSSYTVRVRATDAGGLSLERAFAIEVTDVNLPPTGIRCDGSEVTENLPAGTLVCTLVAEGDEPPGAPYSYALATGAGAVDNGAFVIAGDQLQTAASFDYETKNSYSIRVSVQDAGGLTYAKALAVRVVDENLAPIHLSLSNTAVPENEPAGTLVGSLTTIDTEAPAGPFLYALVTGDGDSDNDLFTVSGDQLRTNAEFDYEDRASYSIRVRSTDQGGLSYDEVFTIDVADVNLAPAEVRLSSTSIAENLPAGSPVGTFTTTDDEPPWGPFAYALVPGPGDADNTSFVIVDDQLTTAQSFDYETRASYSIRVRSTDQGGLFREEVFTIDVSDVNLAPLDIHLSSTSLAENAPAGSLVGTFSTVDEEPPSAPFVYALVSGAGDSDNATFLIAGDQLRTAEPFDYEARTSYSIRVRSMDQGGLSWEKVFTIDVIDVNLAPADVHLSSTSIAENAPAGSLVGIFTTTDDEPPSAPFTYALVPGAGDSDNAMFLIAGDQLQTAKSFDYEAQATYSIRVRSTDQGGLFREEVFTIDVTDVNLAPADILLSSTDVAENLPAGSLVGIFTTADDEPPSAPFTYALVSGDGDTDNAMFLITGDQLKTAASFDYEARTSYSIRVRSTDQGGLTCEEIFAINVIDANLAPTEILLSSTSVAEHQPAGTLVGVLSAIDPEAPAESFSYALVTGEGDADNQFFAIAGDQLKTNTELDYEIKSSYSIRVEATDAGGMAFEKILALEVTNESDGWQNPANAFDVNGLDGVTPLDVLLLINYINAHPDDLRLPAPPQTPPPYLDVNDDGYCTAEDVLLVINHINARSAAQPEGEPTDIPATRPVSGAWDAAFTAGVERAVTPRILPETQNADAEPVDRVDPPVYPSLESLQRSATARPELRRMPEDPVLEFAESELLEDLLTEIAEDVSKAR